MKAQWITVCVAFSVVGAGCAERPSSPSERQYNMNTTYENLLSKVRDQGSLQVITGLVVTSGAEHPTPEEIEELQEELVASLPPDHVEVVNRFTVIPFIVLRADETGLRALIASPLVESIEEDIATPPSN